jgi:uncharacterized protein (TIGR03067 family)
MRRCCGRRGGSRRVARFCFEDLTMRTKCLLALGVVALVLSALTAADKDTVKDKDEAKFDPAKLVGTWTYVSAEEDGKKKTADDFKKATVEITKETITLKSDDATYVIKYTLDTKKSPAQIAMEITKGPQGEGAKSTGIIELKGDELKLCYDPMHGDAPKEFSAKEGSKLHLFVLKPMKK